MRRIGLAEKMIVRALHPDLRVFPAEMHQSRQRLTLTAGHQQQGLTIGHGLICLIGTNNSSGA